VPKLSVTIITKNEAGNIEDALRSVAWADECIVVDAESSDDTVARAKRHARQVVVRPWPGYIAQKNYAASIAAYDWILSLDADERVSPPLAAEIQALMATEPEHAAYRMPRVTQYLGRWMRTTDWYPDAQLRLYDRRRAEWTGRYVHEGLTVQGSIGRLRGELEHLGFRDIAEHLETIDRYTTYAARQMHESGRRTGVLPLVLQPPFAFLRNYILRGGARDGATGLILSILNSYYVFLKFAKLWEIQGHPATPQPPATPVQPPATSGVQPPAP
jgi:glycosyltransferase involved in cell wall biosynthesis